MDDQDIYLKAESIWKKSENYYDEEECLGFGNWLIPRYSMIQDHSKGPVKEIKGSCKCGVRWWK